MKTYSKYSISLKVKNVFGILPNIVKAVLFGNIFRKSRDALNNCNDNKMNERDALEIIHQVSKGVKELHNHRITHRDLKP